MKPTNQFVSEVRIWGARGSLPVAGTETLRAGGNTACVEVRCGERTVILDAGTGIRARGAETGQGNEHHIFLTHFHWDHIQGVPFFAPLYDAASTVHFYSAIPAEELERTLSSQMMQPYFPVSFESLAAQRRFHQVVPPVQLGELRLSTVPLHHPGGSHGYVVETPDARIVYATDHEHGDAWADAALLEAAQGADVLIYDAHYTPEEYATHQGWGHSTWLEAVRLAQRANVRRLLLFHHHPDHTDFAMDAMLERARQEFPATELAAEGVVFCCGADPVRT